MINSQKNASMWFCRAVGSLTQQSWISHLLCCFIMDHEMDVCCCIGPILKTFFVILVSFSINHVTFFGTLTISRIVQLYAWNRNGGRRPPQASGPTIPPPPGSPTKPFTIKYFSSEWFELCWRKRSHAFYPADINIWSSVRFGHLGYQIMAEGGLTQHCRTSLSLDVLFVDVFLEQLLGKVFK